MKNDKHKSVRPFTGVNAVVDGELDVPSSMAVGFVPADVVSSEGDGPRPLYSTIISAAPAVVSPAEKSHVCAPLCDEAASAV
jgi:hypothetical protein